jgi:ribonuclease HI
MKQLSLFEQSKDSPATKRERWDLFVDGAARKNPGPAGAGIYLANSNEPIVRKSFYLGHKTNNQAEYLALLLGLFYAKKHIGSHDFLAIKADSELLVKQIKGIYTVRNALLKPLYLLALEMLDGMSYSCSHIVREHNTQADALANKGIDMKTSVTQEFLALLKAHDISL